MNLKSHIDVLKQRHKTLDQRLNDEEKRPLPDAAVITAFKLQKLKLKQQIEQFEIESTLA